MTAPDNSLFTRIHTLSARQLDDALTPAEHDELQTLLLESEAARRAYISYFQDTACLRWLCLEELAAAIEPAKPAVGQINFGRVRRRIEIITFFGSACILGLIALGWLLKLGTDSPAGGPDRTSVAAAVSTDQPALGAEAPAAAQSPASQVATITKLGAVRWAEPSASRRLLSRCVSGERLEFDDGAIELTFDAGAQVTVFGPADFTITSATSINCKRGRVTTLVGDRGKGFVVQTPQAKVVDLGTQFGLSISDKGETEVVVFQGSVDMSAASAVAKSDAPTRRMFQGEALLLNNEGRFERVVSVRRSDFLRAVDGIRRTPEPVIADVRDNIRTAEGVKSYQIVSGGMDEDALSFVDRNHQWNGLDEKGLPMFLVGADYVMPFNDDKFAGNLKLKIRLLRPADLYVFLDNNMSVPGWIRDGFEDTGIDIGLDGAKTEWHKRHDVGIGPGQSIDFPFSVWRKKVTSAGTVTLGSVDPPKKGDRSYGFNMYGIAAVAAE
jgi:ferric-dicitrate binding protein FerR (iron transport regulator)